MQVDKTTTLPKPTGYIFPENIIRVQPQNWPTTEMFTKEQLVEYGKQCADDSKKVSNHTQVQTNCNLLKNSEQEFKDTFRKEIFRELSLEIDDTIEDEMLDRAWKMCEGNPWDAVAVWQFMQALKK